MFKNFYNWLILKIQLSMYKINLFHLCFSENNLIIEISANLQSRINKKTQHNDLTYSKKCNALAPLFRKKKSAS